MLKRKSKMSFLVVLFLLSLGACSTTPDKSREFASEKAEKTHDIDKDEYDKEPAWRYHLRRYR